MHTGLWTVVQSHTDPFLEVPGSGCSGTGVPLPLWAFYSPLCSPMNGNTLQPRSQGGFDLRSKAKKWEEEEGESGPVVGPSPWFWGGDPWDGGGAGCLCFSKLTRSERVGF